MAEHKHHGGAPAHADPDPELSLSGILWTAVGTMLVAAVAMVLMAWFGGGMLSNLEAGGPPLTPAEARAAAEAQQAGEERLEAAELPDMPGLALPADAVLPPGPRLETTLSAQIDRLRRQEDELLDEWGWADEEAGTVHVPISAAIDLAVEGALPGLSDLSGLPGLSPEAAIPGDAAGGGTAGQPTGAEPEEVRDAA